MQDAQKRTKKVWRCGEPIIPRCVWGVRVQHGLSVGSRNQHESAEHRVDAPTYADPGLHEHFAQRISNTVTVSSDSLLQQGIQTLSFVEAVHVLGVLYNKSND